MSAHYAKMLTKTARSDCPTAVRARGMVAAVGTARRSCRKARKARTFTPSRDLLGNVGLVAFGGAALPERRYQTAVVVTILMLVGVRLACAAATTLCFDEALYWLWSRHIAGGYYDHPPINPILIRLGTTLFGNTEFGVRVFCVLLALPASWAIWRSGAILFKDERVGATVALYFNLTLLVAVGSALATPDNAVVAATAFLLLTLAKLYDTGRGAWWLAIGVAFGVGMLSKYTTIFFAVSILAWLLLVPELRKWLVTPWPWLSGAIALAVFSPTLIWNAQHHWASVLYQYNRLVVHEWSLRYLGEFLATQFGMATPSVFILGAMGLVALLRGGGGSRGARLLVNAMVWPILLYFVWNTFHGRVEGNWPEPIYVPFVIAAAVAVERNRMERRLGRRRVLGATACRARRAGNGGAHLFAGGVRARRAWADGSDGAHSGRGLEAARRRDGPGATAARRAGRLDAGLRARQLACVLYAVTSARRADQRTHALRQRSGTGSCPVSRHDDVCLHGRVRQHSRLTPALHDGGTGGRLDANAAWCRPSGLSRLQPARPDRASARPAIARPRLNRVRPVPELRLRHLFRRDNHDLITHRGVVGA